MGYLDSSDAILIALTRMRRAERRRVLRKTAASTLYFDKFSTKPHRPDDPRSAFWQGKRRERPETYPHAIEHPNNPWWRTYYAQNGACYLCGNPFTDDHWATDEHVVPRCLGGGNHKNVLLAHYGCNTWKASRPPRPCEMIYLESILLIKSTTVWTFEHEEFATA